MKSDSDIDLDLGFLSANNSAQPQCEWQSTVK